MSFKSLGERPSYERDLNQKCFCRFDVIEKRNRNLLRRLLDRNFDEEASPNSAESKAKTFYHSCVKKTEDLEQVNRLDLVELIQVCLLDSNTNPFSLPQRKPGDRVPFFSLLLLLLLGTFYFFKPSADANLNFGIPHTFLVFLDTFESSLIFF